MEEEVSSVGSSDALASTTQNQDADSAAAGAAGPAPGDVPDDAASLLEALEAAKETKDFTLVIRKVGSIFSSAESLSACFTLPDVTANESQHGINLDHLTRFYAAAEDEECEPVTNALRNALRIYAAGVSFATAHATDPKSLRHILIVLLAEQVLSDPEMHMPVLKHVLDAVTSLPRNAEQVLRQWLASLDADHVKRLLGVLHQFITLRIFMTQRVAEFVPAVRVMSLLHDAVKESRAVSMFYFHNDAVNQEMSIPEDYKRWRVAEAQNQTVFSFCEFPFILDAASKAEVLRIDAAFKMRDELRASFMSLQMGMGMPYLVLEVNRDNIVQDTMRQVSALRQNDLRKPLKVKFRGEEGVDEGGVQKEFFQVVTRQLFDASYGMFNFDERSKTFWFNGNSLEARIEFEFIGVILGLAIYNGVILDVRLPMVVYKKMLGRELDLDDLTEMKPEVGKSLKQMLSYDGDVQEAMDLTFAVEYEYFGAIRAYELKPGGKDIPVTKENREEYVRLYVDYTLNKSVEVQFGAFKTGFDRVAGGPVLDMFAPEELELLVCGSKILDFDAMEKATHYDGYEANDPVIRNFWSIVHEMTPEEQRTLLKFTTGSDRAPINGLGEMKFVIAKNGEDSDRLPTAHTCFNALMLPRYGTRERLKERLFKAMAESEGFGLL